MKQFLTISQLVFIKAWRSNLLPALVLVMLPLFYAAWAFESTNPGFQTGFLADLSGSTMSLLAGMLIFFLGLEHFFWPADQKTPWFFLSRAGGRSLFATGKLVGVAGVLFAALSVFSLVFFLMMFFSEGRWFFSLLTTTLLVFYEATLLAAVLQLLAAIFSKLLAGGCLLVIYVASHNLDNLRTAAGAFGSLPEGAATVIFALLPDLGLFRGVWYTDFSLPIMLYVTCYTCLQLAFYLAMTGIILRRQDL